MSALAQLLQHIQIQSGDLVNAESETKGGSIFSESHQPLGEALQADDTLRSRICHDLEVLGHNSAKIEHDFVAIHRVLNDMEGQQALPSNDKFVARWWELRTIYTNTMSESKASTKELYVQIKKFVNNVLSPVECETDEDWDADDGDALLRIMHLNIYIKNLDAFHNPSVQRGNQFLNLRQEIIRFQQDLNRVLPIVNSKSKGQIQTIQTNIDAVKKIIHELEIKYKQVEDEPLKGLFEFFAKAPAPSTKSRQDIARYIDGKIKELSELSLRLTGAEKEKYVMDNLTRQLESHAYLFSDISEKLSGMEGIWRMLVADAARLRMGLESMKKEDMAFTYNLRAKNLRPVYDALESALVAYISAL